MGRALAFLASKVRARQRGPLLTRWRPLRIRLTALYSSLQLSEPVGSRSTPKELSLPAQEVKTRP